MLHRKYMLRRKFSNPQSRRAGTSMRALPVSNADSFKPQSNQLWTHTWAAQCMWLASASMLVQKRRLQCSFRRLLIYFSSNRLAFRNFGGLGFNTHEKANLHHIRACTNVRVDSSTLCHLSNTLPYISMPPLVRCYRMQAQQHVMHEKGVKTTEIQEEHWTCATYLEAKKRLWSEPFLSKAWCSVTTQVLLLHKENVCLQTLRCSSKLFLINNVTKCNSAHKNRVNSKDAIYSAGMDAIRLTWVLREFTPVCERRKCG